LLRQTNLPGALLTSIRSVLDPLGFGAMIIAPQEFAAFPAAQAQKWPPVIRAANIQPQ
jgi:hypothetical protein